MAMPADAPNALQQVKMGLEILHRTGYLTEDAWIKIDGLIHNGRYVFTRGPANHILDEPLMSFDDSKPVDDDVGFRDAAFYSLETGESAVGTTSDEYTPSSAKSELEPTTSSQFPPETPSNLFTETSSNEGNIMLKPTEPAEKRSTDFLSKVGQEPFAGLVEAHSAFHPTSNSVEGSEIGDSSPELMEASNRELSLHSSLHEADGDDVTPVGGASSQHEQSWRPPYPNVSSRNLVKLDDKWETTHDFGEVDQSGLLFQRPSSQISKMPTVSSSAQLANGGNATALPVDVELGTFRIAQKDFPKKCTVQLDVQLGDTIKVIKPVSGILYFGENLRTKESGQFPKTIFEKSSKAQDSLTSLKKYRPIIEPKSMVLPRIAQPGSPSTAIDMDKVEGMNAAMWDLDKAALGVTPTFVRSLQQELVGKDSVLARSENQSRGSERRQEDIINDMVNKAVEEKLKTMMILNAEQAATRISRTPSSHSEARMPQQTSLMQAPAKSQTCWFWATPNRDCRFTADECRDLHSYVPTGSGEPHNFYKGKPTWGALADPIPSSLVEPVADAKGRKFTCWYWANDKCTNNEETCKYLHKHVPAGVVPKPGSRFQSSKSKSWRGKNEKVNSEEGELGSQRLNNGLGSSAWRDRDQSHTAEMLFDGQWDERSQDRTDAKSFESEWL